ncbi:response regulator transcription factor [Streptacidiphilus sp. P02-A3a]|uniref:response regulator n=1 Tax=Streptacidiphilus sp. P02-A3a TaxID=2704468 RepID=UPI0015F902B9|nr:response regulator transcription factor [Streptacidiphilus sp. P02-A3a]QMU73270.1 response regulator transcription factor [Streptacidiphilus sp. P02-A3a]
MTAPPRPAITLLLADDHAILRETLRESLEAEPDLSVVAEAGDGATALAEAARLAPDLVLLDLEMPGPPASVTVRRLLDLRPRPRIVILSMYDDPGYAQELLTLGVNGYLSKGVGRRRLVSVIREVVEDEARVLLSYAPAERAARPGRLSQRERELLSLVARAHSNRQIASGLGISEATVKRHLQNIYLKLDAASRMDAVNKAVAGSLIPSPLARPR